MLRFLSQSFPARRNDNDLNTRCSTVRTHGKRFFANRCGTVAIMMGITLPIFVGLLGLGVDVPNWYLAKRKAQTAVDAGAISGAYALYYTDSSHVARAAAADGAKRNEFVAGSDTTLTINIPPLSGPYAGDPSAIEVIVTQKQTLFFASILMDDEVNVVARAVAAAVNIGGDVCILGLDKEADGTLEFTGNNVTNVGCGVSSNSNSDASFLVWGSGELHATPVRAVGDIKVGNAADLYSDAPLRSFSLPVKDPYGVKGLDVQVTNMPGTCEAYDHKAQTLVLQPGRYCDGLKLSNADVTFEAGTYYLEDDFDVSGTSTLTGEGITFVLTGSGKDYANVKFAGGTVADLSAPTSGPYEGILFFQDPNAPSFKGNTMITNWFLGGSDMIFAGALYFPNQMLVYTGGADVGGSCLQIIGRKIMITGSAEIALDCPPDMDMAAIQNMDIRLVE